MSDADNDAVMRAHYRIKTYILMRILHPSLEEQLAWLNEFKKVFNYYPRLLIIMSKNNAYLLFILEALNLQLEQEAAELSH